MAKIKNKLLTLSFAASLFAISSNAIDLDAAISMALHKNPDLLVQYANLEESKQNIQLTKSSFNPKLDLSYGYNKRNRVIGTQTEEDGTLSTIISYNLFNGFKDLSNNQSAKFLSKASMYSLEALKNDIALNTKKAYINVLDKINALETFESEYELFNKQLNDAKNRYEQGLLARNDLLQVQVNMSNAKQNVVKAKSDVKISKIKLSNIIGGIDLSNENFEKLKDTNLNLLIDDLTKLEDRSEIKALKMNIESLKKQQTATKGSYLPTLNASFSHNRYYEDLSFNETNGVNNQNIAGLNASWNLYNGGKDKTQLAIYNTQISKIKAQLVKTRLDIQLQYEDAKLNLEVAKDNYETAALALEQAKENYNIVKNRFAEGISTSTDLTDANFLLTSAKQRYSRAYFDKYLSIATLHRVFEIM